MYVSGTKSKAALPNFSYILLKLYAILSFLVISWLYGKWFIR